MQAESAQAKRVHREHPKTSLAQSPKRKAQQNGHELPSDYVQFLIKLLKITRTSGNANVMEDARSRKQRKLY